VREEVEALEDEADLGALAGDVLLAILDQLSVLLAVADRVPVSPQSGRNRSFRGG